MMKDPKNVDEWLRHHRGMGVSRFYIRLEETPELESFLQSQEDVVLTVGKSSGVNEYEEIQVRQRQMVDAALDAASGDMGWMIHIDSDELLAGDLNEIRTLPQTVRTFWMMNVEAVYDGVPHATDSCFQAATFRECNQEGAECKSYANGKGGGRVAKDVRSHGPHRFRSDLADDETLLQGVVVQHYESCDYEQYKKKYKRLAVTDTTQDIPFSYYNESIDAAKEAAETGDENRLRCVYEKHRTVAGLNGAEPESCQL